MTRTKLWRAFATLFIAASLMLAVSPGALAADEHHATPATMTCGNVASPASIEEHAGHGMRMATPAVAADVDLLYIDMMIPHHASIIALSQVALTELQDERLRTIAQAIVDTQATEIEELAGYRLQFYGDAEPQPLDDAAMMQLMGDMSKPMDAMMQEMDADAQVSAFCAADDADLTFIELTIPHHQSAIDASEIVLTQAVHPEIRDFAQRVIDAQQREIADLEQIRMELTGSATPTA